MMHLKNNKQIIKRLNAIIAGFFFHIFESLAIVFLIFDLKNSKVYTFNHRLINVKT